MSIRKTLLLISLLIPFAGFAQKNEYKGFPSTVWPKLYKISYVKGTDQYGDYEKPVFTADVKALQGKRITLPGYMIPFETGQKAKEFMFSSLPVNACFFCGVGGPETVVQVFARSPATFKDRPVNIAGTLKLNDSDPNKMIYILEDAEVVGEIDF